MLVGKLGAYRQPYGHTPRSGQGAQVRLCLYTNYCEALDQRHKQVTCELWDRENLDEPVVMLSSDGKRRLLPP